MNCNFLHRGLGWRGLNRNLEGVMAVDLSAMRKLFQKGLLKEAIVAPAPMQAEAWVLTVVRTDGSCEYMSIARQERHKIYSSAGAALADARRVGFSEVRAQVA